MDQVAFIRARLDEDEAIASTVIDHQDFAEANSFNAFDAEPRAFLDRFGPVSTLVDIAAKRMLLDTSDGEVIAILANKYADHPDYQSEWGHFHTHVFREPYRFDDGQWKRQCVNPLVGGERCPVTITTPPPPKGGS